ncbi:MAG TPA: DsbA family protein [Caulobacteraceae bacterium]
MSLRTNLMRAATSALTSRAVRGLRRGRFALRRRIRGGRAVICYFHQPDDPYSRLTAQMLAPLAARYDVEIRAFPVPPPSDAAAPEREKLAAYAIRDARRIAPAYGLDPDLDDPPVFEATVEEGGAERTRLGHYLGAMFWFDGEWFWGLDRLGHLEARLAALGLDREPGKPPLAPSRDIVLPPLKAKPKDAVIELWFSFRSPYSYLALPRIRRLAAHYGAELRLRPILPMVMRGLPVPAEKRLYIVLDCKREAERLGLPFGRIVDPVGAGAERALAVLHHAVPLGLGEAFSELAARGAFADGIALAEDGGLNDVAARAGLTHAQVAEALADDSWRAAVEDNREALFAAGLWGPPSFRLNGGPAWWGQDRLWVLEEELQALV